MKQLFLAALLTLTAACGAYHFPGSSAGNGTVTGHVVAIPCSPVENSAITCQGRPVPGLEIQFSAEDGSRIVTKTDSTGAYSVQLAAGTWKVILKTIRVIRGPSTVTVSSGSTVVVDYAVDSGIRVPVPIA